MKVRPKPLAAPLSSLPLSPEEGFVLSRIDGRLSVSDLEALTGIDGGRLAGIVARLEAHGVVSVEDEAAAEAPPAPSSRASLADFAEALGMDPEKFGGKRSSSAMKVAQPAEPELEPQLEAVADEPASDGLIPVDGDGEEAVQESPEVAANERNYRQLYQTKFHATTTDARVAAAKTSSGADLCALCFDPDPKIVAAILENHLAGFDHARLIAMHHHTTTGLELLSRRLEFLRDALVERRLLRNNQCGDAILRRILASKRIVAVYKVAIDREIPEMNRVKARGHLKKSWQTSTSEERADFVLRTEARCLQHLTGCTFDAKATQILCGRNYASAIFVQNVAKFPAAPPALLAHLMKQPFVRKNVALKRMLLQHPNIPGEVKRNM